VTEANKKNKRVLFVQKFVPHYRLPLFEQIRDKLADKGIEFILIYGPPDPYEGSKIRMEYPEWGKKVKSIIFPLPGKFTRYLYWQGAPFKIKKGDVVIVEHASKLLDNYILFVLQQIGIVYMCYFGHGRNFQAHREIALARKIKQFMIKRVSLWFAYTDISKDVLLKQSVPEDKIVVVNNTLKVKNILQESDVSRKKHKFVYIGGLYKEKKLEFVIESVKSLVADYPEIELHIAGTGPDEDEIKAFADKHQWCHYIGSIFGEERDKLLLSSSAILMPGLVGLVAIDTFHYAIPLITIDAENHSPEIAYLTNGENALIGEKGSDIDQYSKLVRKYIDDNGFSEKLRQGCRDSAERYTLSDTADKFVNGVLKLS